MLHNSSPSPLDFSHLAAMLLSDLQQRVDLEGWWVLRRNTHEHVVLAAIDDVFGQGPGTVVSWQDSFCRLTVEEGAPAVAADIDEVASYAAARSRNGIPARSLVVVPLQDARGQVIGILRALGTQVRPDLEQHLATVTVAAAALTTLLCQELELDEQVRRAERAESAAHVDALTQVANRRAWDSALADEEARCSRYADRASIIVLDLNDLKGVNDSLGHAAGDELLMRTAAVLSGRLRTCDVVARTGGDEFSVLLTGTDLPSAEVVAADLRRLLSATGSSASMGVAARRSSSSLIDAWHDADAAMYLDKRVHRASRGPRGGHDATEPVSGIPAPRSARAVAPTLHTPSSGSASSATAVEDLVDLVRRQLGAEVAVVQVGRGRHLKIRALITDPRRDVDVEQLRAAIGTTALDGSTLGDVGLRCATSTPILRSNGQPHGSLHLFSRHPVPKTAERLSAGVLAGIAEPLARLLEDEERLAQEHGALLVSLDRLTTAGGLQMHYQPIVDLHTRSTVGAEALARIPGSQRRPDEWFALAAAAGSGVELELRAVRAALSALLHSHGPRGFLAVNVSPQTVCAPALARALGGVPLDRVVLEITEHEQVGDYAQIRGALAPLRARGLRVAVDDTGAGYASMSHVLALVPDFIKLDISLVRNVHADPARRALAAAMTTFAAATDAQVVAEGIETAEELACLKAVGVHYGQGFHLARPAPMPAADEAGNSAALLGS